MYYVQHRKFCLFVQTYTIAGCLKGVVLNRTPKDAQISVLLHNIVVFDILLDFVYTFSYVRNCAMCVL